VNPPSVDICDYEGSDYQQTFWERGGREYEDGAEALALRRLLPRSGNHLLEIGAGAGRNTPRYAGFDRVTLLDYSLSQLEQARRRLGDSPRYQFVAADVYRMPFGAGSFDAATMIRTLHHLRRPQAALESVREVLAGGGSLILEYANKRNLKAVGRWLLRRQAWSPFDPAPVEFTRLNFDFHPREVRRWLAGAMFHVKRQLPVSHLRLGWLKRSLPLGLLLAAEGALQRLGGAWLYTPSVFVGAQAVGAGEAPHFSWRCPACGSGRVTEAPGGLHCASCRRRWARVDGIYDFRA
jgi:SAM-dependent methyltransferase